MSERLTPRKIVAVTAALALIGTAWQALAQPQGSDQAQSKQGQMMDCPMMSGMKNLKLHADSPAVLLAMEEQLELTQEQRQRLEDLAGDVGTQARKILTAEQQQQLAKAPEGPLSMMQVMMHLRKGQGADQGQMCPMCMQMMRERMQKMQEAKPAEDSGEHAENHAERDGERR